MLHRALGAVKQGCYIDIGAQDPTFDSVSKHFHEAGWQGVHVEPHPEYASQLREARPGDLVLQVAVGEQTGLISFHSFSGTGLSTSLDDVASRHVEAGFSSELIAVPCITMDELLGKCGFDEVHWLKLDVEGAERSVIASWKSSKVRPWIIVVEAIAPGGRTDTSARYEDLLLAKGYRSVYFDGLNKFYISDLHPELEQHFKYGPSLWDEIQAPRENKIARTLVEGFKVEREVLASELGCEKNSLQAALEEAQAGKLELDAAKAELETARTSYQLLSERLNDQITAAKMADARASVANEAMLVALAEVSAARSSREVLEAEITRQRSDLKQALADLSKVQADLTEAVTKHMGAQAVAANLQRELDRNIADTERLVQFLTQERNRLERDLTDLHDRFDAIVANANAQAHENALNLESLHRQINTLLGESEEASSAQAELEGQLEFGRQESAALRAHIRQLESDIDVRETRITSLVGSLEALASSSANGSARAIRAQILELLESSERSAVIQSRGEELVARSIDELLLVGDRQFIDACYRTLLGRQADGAGATHYLERLAKGERRAAIISDIARSRESVAFSPATPGLPRLLNPRRFLSVPIPPRLARILRLETQYRSATILSDETAQTHDTVPTVSALLSATGENFLHQAYALVLGRTPDPVGLTHFSARLAAGDERLELLAALRWSEEGVGRARHEPNVDRATAWYRTRKWPAIGPWRRDRAIRRWMPGDKQRQMRLDTQLSELELELQTRALTEVSLAGRPIDIVFGKGDAELAASKALDEALSHFYRPKAASPALTLKVFGALDKTCRAEVWYADNAAIAQMGPGVALPTPLEALACTDVASERTLIQQGHGLAVRAIGSMEGEARGATALRMIKLAQDLNRSAGRRRQLARSEPLRVAVLTTWNTRCGIATHSEELADAFAAAKFQMLAPLTADLLAPDKPNVFRLWQTGKERNGLERVLDHLQYHPTDLLIVQFNFGFFNHAELSAFIRSAASLGVTVFVIFHSTHEPLDADGWRLKELVPGLAECGQIIVHTPGDVVVFQSLGLAKNVLLLPHGVRAGHQRPRPSQLRPEPILSSFGFCLPNKGLVELVEAVAILREQGIRIRLRMLNSLHPDPSSAETLRAIRDKIAERSLDDMIEVVSDFLDADTIDREISRSDLFVNPYQSTGESASGAVRVGLRNRVPTLVTPLRIFDDLGRAAYRMPGISPTEMAEGIKNALRTLRDPDQARAWDELLHNWLEFHDFRTQAMRLDGICRTMRINAILDER
jgi:FkbM family methyltransferase